MKVLLFINLPHQILTFIKIKYIKYNYKNIVI